MKGDECLQIAKAWILLVIAMRYFWEQKHGTHFEGLFDPVLDNLSPHSGMLRLAREIARAGVDARSSLLTEQYQSSPHHPSALAHLDKILEGAWKDAQKGRFLYLTSASIPILDGVISVPLGFVPKSLPDRTVSTTDGREVVDPKIQNDNVTKELFHPALMPSHKGLGRTIVWWQQRHPGLSILLAKKELLTHSNGSG